MAVDALRGAADRLRLVYLDRPLVQDHDLAPRIITRPGAQPKDKFDEGVLLPLLRVVRRRLRPEDGHDVLVLRNVCTVLVQLRGKSSRLSEISNDNPGEVAMHRATLSPSRREYLPHPGRGTHAAHNHGTSSRVTHVTMCLSLSSSCRNGLNWASLKPARGRADGLGSTLRAD